MSDTYTLRLSNSDRNLIGLQTYLLDTTANSKDYFRISELPSEFCSGKNSFKLYGNVDALLLDSLVYVEVRDAAGNLLYTEIQDTVDRLGRREIIVHVYPENAAGLGTIVLIGTATTDLISARTPTEIPNEYQGVPNIKWVHQLNIEPLKKSTAEIKLNFDSKPEVTFTEIYKKFNVLTYTSGSEYSASYTGSFVYTYSPYDKTVSVNSGEYKVLYDPALYGRETYSNQNVVQLRKTSAESNAKTLLDPRVAGEYVSKGVDAPYGFSVDSVDSPILTSIGTDIFQSKHVGAKIVLPNPSVTAPNQYAFYSDSDKLYVTRISKVLDSRNVVLSNEYERYVLGNSPVSQSYNPKYMTAGLINLTGSSIPTYSESNAYKTIGRLQFKNLKPLTGNIYKVKTYGKSKSGIADYKLLGENIIPPQSLLINKNTPEYGVEIGSILDQSSVQSYWTSSALNTNDALNLVYTRRKLLDSFYTNGVLTAGSWTVYPNISGSVFTASLNSTDSYQLSLNVYGIQTGSLAPSLKIYMSGSAFNSLLGETNGKLIGSINPTTSDLKLNGLTLNFNSDNDGIGTPIFVVEGGQWYFSDIKLTTSQEPGYAPSFFDLDIEMPTTWDSETMDLKFEFYNSVGAVSDDVILMDNVPIQNGNSLYIQGQNNYMTGSLTATGSINMTGSFIFNGVNMANLTSLSGNAVLRNLADSAVQMVEGSLKLTGDIIAENYIVSSSVVYMTTSFASGSTIFGNTLDDNHRFTGSVYITGGLAINNYTIPYRFENGISASGAFLRLGGDLTQNTDISASSNNYPLRYINSSNGSYFGIYRDANGGNVFRMDNPNSGNAASNTIYFYNDLGLTTQILNNSSNYSFGGNTLIFHKISGDIIYNAQAGSHKFYTNGFLGTQILKIGTNKLEMTGSIGITGSLAVTNQVQLGTGSETASGWLKYESDHFYGYNSLGQRKKLDNDDFAIIVVNNAAEFSGAFTTIQDNYDGGGFIVFGSNITLDRDLELNHDGITIYGQGNRLIFANSLTQDRLYSITVTGRFCNYQDIIFQPTGSNDSQLTYASASTIFRMNNATQNTSLYLYDNCRFSYLLNDGWNSTPIIKFEDDFAGSSHVVIRNSQITGPDDTIQKTFLFRLKGNANNAGSYDINLKALEAYRYDSLYPTTYTGFYTSKIGFVGTLHTGTSATNYFYSDGSSMVDVTGSLVSGSESVITDLTILNKMGPSIRRRYTTFDYTDTANAFRYLQSQIPKESRVFKVIMNVNTAFTGSNIKLEVGTLQNSASIQTYTTELMTPGTYIVDKWNKYSQITNLIYRLSGTATGGSADIEVHISTE